MKDLDVVSTDDHPWSELESAWRGEEIQADLSRVESSSPLPDPQVETDLRRIARMGQRELLIRRIVRIGEALVFLIFGALAVKWILLGPTDLRVAGIFVSTVLVGSAILRHQALIDFRSESAAPPGVFVDTLLERNKKGFRAVTFGKVLLAIEVAFFTAWLAWSRAPGTLQEVVNTFGFLVVWSAGFLIALHLIRRYLDRQRKHLEEFRDQLHGVGPDFAGK